MNSRFLLALYETNAKLERGASSFSSFSAGMGRIDLGQAGSPELPDFLHSLGGPIQSIPDGELEILDSAPAPLSEGEEEVGMHWVAEAGEVSDG